MTRNRSKSGSSQRRSGNSKSQHGRPQSRKSSQRSGGGAKTSPEQQEQQSQAGNGNGRENESGLMRTAKQHPYASAAVGAAASLLLAEGARRLVTSWGSSSPSSKTSPDQPEQQDEQEQEEPQAQDSAQDQADEQDEEQEQDEGPDQARQGGGRRRGGARGAFQSARERAGDATRRAVSSLGDQAQSAFQQGRETGAQFWEEHPLLIAGAALAAGVVIGMMLPSTETENSLLGKWSDRTAGKLKNAGRDIVDQGKEMVTRAISEGSDAMAREAEREGLTPTRLSRKIKRVGAQVRDAVSDAVQSD